MNRNDMICASPSKASAAAAASVSAASASAAAIANLESSFASLAAAGMGNSSSADGYHGGGAMGYCPHSSSSSSGVSYQPSPRTPRKQPSIMRRGSGCNNSSYNNTSISSFSPSHNSGLGSLGGGVMYGGTGVATAAGGYSPKRGISPKKSGSSMILEEVSVHLSMPSFHTKQRSTSGGGNSSDETDGGGGGGDNWICAGCSHRNCSAISNECSICGQSRGYYYGKKNRASSLPPQQRHDDDDEFNLDNEISESTFADDYGGAGDFDHDESDDHNDDEASLVFGTAGGGGGGAAGAGAGAGAAVAGELNNSLLSLDNSFSLVEDDHGDLKKSDVTPAHAMQQYNLSMSSMPAAMGPALWHNSFSDDQSIVSTRSMQTTSYSSGGGGRRGSGDIIGGSRGMMMMMDTIATNRSISDLNIDMNHDNNDTIIHATRRSITHPISHSRQQQQQQQQHNNNNNTRNRSSATSRRSRAARTDAAAALARFRRNIGGSNAGSTTSSNINVSTATRGHHLQNASTTASAGDDNGGGHGSVSTRALSASAAASAGGGFDGESSVLSFCDWNGNSKTLVQNWTCATCTYVNDQPLHLICAMCGHSRSSTNEGSEAAAAARAEADDDDDDDDEADDDEDDTENTTSPRQQAVATTNAVAAVASSLQDLALGRSVDDDDDDSDDDDDDDLKFLQKEHMREIVELQQEILASFACNEASASVGGTDAAPSAAAAAATSSSSYADYLATSSAEHDDSTDEVDEEEHLMKLLASQRDILASMKNANMNHQNHSSMTINFNGSFSNNALLLSPLSPQRKMYARGGQHHHHTTTSPTAAALAADLAIQDYFKHNQHRSPGTGGGAAMSSNASVSSGGAGLMGATMPSVPENVSISLKESMSMAGGKLRYNDLCLPILWGDDCILSSSNSIDNGKSQDASLKKKTPPPSGGGSCGAQDRSARRNNNNNNGK
jgi:hypothetical protein